MKELKNVGPIEYDTSRLSTGDAALDRESHEFWERQRAQARSDAARPLEQPVTSEENAAKVAAKVEALMVARWTPEQQYKTNAAHESRIAALEARLVAADQQIAFLTARVKPALIRDRAARPRDRTPPEAA